VASVNRTKLCFQFVKGTSDYSFDFLMAASRAPSRAACTEGQ
jgi:hypothetical protein